MEDIINMGLTIRHPVSLVLFLVVTHIHERVNSYSIALGVVPIESVSFDYRTWYSAC